MATRARIELEQVILPFWLEHGVDSRHGGFFTCFDNRGRRRVSSDKYTWSQGRFVWLLARAARLGRTGTIAVDADATRQLAIAGGQFLVQHAVRDDGTTCHYVLDETGAPTPRGPATSVYADLFVVMGLSELARCTGSEEWLAPATRILTRAEEEIIGRRAPTPPYPVPAGHRAFGPSMILANVRLEHLRALAALGLPTDEGSAALARAARLVLDHRRTDGTFVEMVPDAGEPADTMVARHRVPGHALEGIWVLLEAARDFGIELDSAALADSVDALCRSAWDTEHGGLFRYVDASGPVAPRGRSGNTPLEALISRTWDTKLWWVHTEASYTAALTAARTRCQAALAWRDRIWAYTLATFPGGPDGAEWVQIRTRGGEPLDEVVALPVKDPFHIARNLMQLAELGAGTDGSGMPA